MRAIGDHAVFPIGLGCAFLSLSFANYPDRVSATLNAAHSAGINHFDTAHVYTPADEDGHNERLIGQFLKQVGADAPSVSTKGGHFRTGDQFGIDGRPAVIRAHCEVSLINLNVEQIDLYYLHWPDPSVPFEESVGMLATLQQEGKVKQIGLSNVTVAQIERARQVADIAAVQNKLSLLDRSNFAVAEYCEREGIAFVAYSPLGSTGAPVLRIPAVKVIARKHNVSPAQVALAWILTTLPTTIPLAGATRPITAADAAAAPALRLTDADVKFLDDCV